MEIPLRARDGSIRAYALVDDADLEWAAWLWRLTSSGYARRCEGGRYLYLHRELLGLSPGDGLEGDHRNGDRLDNRRSNLRAVTRAQNSQNIRRAPASSSHRGVSWNKAKGRWRAYVRLGGKLHHLGYFASEEDAAAGAAASRAEHMPYATG